MREHHRRVVDKLIERFQEDPNFLAMMVAGSIAKGWEREDSDVDVMLVVTEAEYARRKVTNEMQYFTMDLCDYPGGYVDGKIIDLDFMKEVAQRGSEPARSAFSKVLIAYSHVDGLDDLVQTISVYDESQYAHKVSSFYAQVQALQWYVSEAEKRDQKYLMMHSVSDLVLFGCRMILAYNRILYPYHKWLLNAVRDAPQKPQDFLLRIETLLAQPGKQNADAFTECVITFTDWPMPTEGWPSRFMEDSEWGWRRGSVDISDW